MKQLLTEPVTGSSGTATYCSISGMDVAAKTGTTNDNYDRWLCGFTPYYTAVCWYGFDMNESINFNGKNPAGLIWSNVMKNIHSDLPNKKFEKTDGVITSIICKDSGKTANSSCPNTFTEYFLKGTMPDICTQHSGNSLNTNKSNTKNTNTNNSRNNTNENSTYKKEENNLTSSPPQAQNTTKTEENNLSNETVNKNSTFENKTPNNNTSIPSDIAKNNTINNTTTNTNTNTNSSTTQNNVISNENLN